LGHDAVLGVERLHLGLLEVGVQLDLVNGGDDLGLIEQVREVLDHEVADADGADLAVLEQRLQRPVSLKRLVEVGRQRLVQDQQVDLVDAELAGALVEGVQRLVTSVVADPDLGLQEDRRTTAFRRVHRFADLALVAVCGGRVNVAVAGVERGRYRAARLVRRCLEDAEADRGHLDAVVQGNAWYFVCHGDTPPNACCGPRRVSAAVWSCLPRAEASTRMGQSSSWASEDERSR
jgi:hypothetical protein